MKFIQTILCSIQNQSFKELEIIFIDDYSKDESIKKIKFNMKKDKRIILLKIIKIEEYFIQDFLHQQKQKVNI